MQANVMMLGEMLCMVAYLIYIFCVRKDLDTEEPDTEDTKVRDTEDTKERDTEDTKEPSTEDTKEPDTEDTKDKPKPNPFLFLFPALCDVVATSMMYVGLTYTSASQFQVRGERSLVLNSYPDLTHF